MPAFLDILTPVNLREEEEKFFSDKTYNPQLKYRWEKVDFDNFYLKKPSRKSLVEAFLSRDSQKITKESSGVFETRVDNETLSLAKEYTKETPSKIDTTPPQLIARKFEEVLKYFEIDYKVLVVKKRGFGVRPRHSSKEIWISEGAERPFFTVEGVLKHEMVHIIRKVNSVANNIGTNPNFLPTEEGLATFIHDERAEGGETARFQHAAEYVASSVGVNGSFVDIFNCLVDLGFPEKLAWQRGIRHKYGFMDTSKPGDIMKPAMYFAHSLEIGKLSDEEKLRLFVGKIPTNKLSEFPEYRGAVERGKIVKYFSLKV